MKPTSGTIGPQIESGSPGAAAVDDGTRWYAVYTLPNREFRAKTQLDNQGFRVFLPQRLKATRHARRLLDVARPYFPRYLFIQLDLSRHAWRSVNGTFGVASLVMQGERPHPIPRGVVETMINSVDAKGFLRLDQRLTVGSQIRIAAGPFAEKLATLDRLDDSGRVRVLLEILGGPVNVYVARELVMPAA
jgi:transcription elongation factor/antiterminator RfaH